MEMSTLAEMATTVGAFGALYGALRREIRAVDTRLSGVEMRLDAKIDGQRSELKADIARLDDRIYALASGLRPLLEQAQRTD